MLFIYRKSLKLFSYFSVHPLIQVPNQLVGAPVGTDVTLICNAEASPKAINYWQRENGESVLFRIIFILNISISIDFIFLISMYFFSQQ